jgi:hypothetical protein
VLAALASEGRTRATRAIARAAPRPSALGDARPFLVEVLRGVLVHPDRAALQKRSTIPPTPIRQSSHFMRDLLLRGVQQNSLDSVLLRGFLRVYHRGVSWR